MQVRAGVCVGTRGLPQMSFSITLHFPLGDRDGTIALVEPGALHFIQTGQPGSFWDSPISARAMPCFLQGLLLLQQDFLPIKSFSQPQVHIVMQELPLFLQLKIEGS